MPSDTLKAIIERIKHPILGTYFISLAVLNWRILFYAFSGDAQASTRIESIQKYLKSSTFSDSLWKGLLALAFYLYILPLISNLLTLGRRIIQIREVRWDINFQDRLQSEKSMAGNIEVIATDLKNQNKEFNAYLKQITNFLNFHVVTANLGTISKEAQILSKTAVEFIKKNEEYLEYSKDILNNNYGGTPLERAKTFHKKRQRS